MPQTWPTPHRQVNPDLRIFAERVAAPRVIDPQGKWIIYVIVVQPMMSGSFTLHDCRELVRADATNDVFGLDATDLVHNYAGSVIQVGARLHRGITCSEIGAGGEFITIHY